MSWAYWSTRLWKRLVVGGVLGEHFDLVGRNIAAEGFALLPPLEIIIRAVGALAQDAELARLHVLDLGDLLEQLSSLGSVRLLHEQKYIYMHILWQPK